MKRKVIQIADSTQLVSLPRKWAVAHGIKKGDEIDVVEEGSRVVISTEKRKEGQEITLDVEGMDRSSIVFAIRSAYKAGYDTINVKFTKPVTIHPRLNKEVKVFSAIHEEVNRLIGVEIIQQKENFCVIKALSQLSAEEFDTAFRRIFLLLNDASNELIEGLKSNNQVVIEVMEEKHDTITKFISYCLRLLNKKGHPEPEKIAVLYQIITDLDTQIDVLKNIARSINCNKHKLSADALGIIDGIIAFIPDYYNFFYNYSQIGFKDMYSKRNGIIEAIDKNINKLTNCDIKIIGDASLILETIIDLMEARMELDHISLIHQQSATGIKNGN